MKTLVTCALPYANGPIHLGHMVEHIQTDIFVRFLRSQGEQVVFLCADDTHGTAIEISAEKQGITPEKFIEQVSIDHQAVFRDFQVSFDLYSSTNSPENRQYAELIYNRAKEAGFIGEKDVEQAFDETANRFLADRFIKGECPNCGTKDQYGDACEKCSATYGPKELKNPYSVLSGKTPVWKTSKHLFFKLPKHEAFLKEQLAKPGFMNAGLATQLQQFFQKGLADWDISRDGPYFGFPIPGETNKFFYVWLDAPLVTSRRPRCGPRPPARRRARSISGRRTPTRASFTSSARTSSTSTASSGRRCSRSRGSRFPRRCTFTGTSR